MTAEFLNQLLHWPYCNVFLAEVYEKSLASHRYVVGKGGIFNILIQIIFFNTALKMDKYVKVFSFFLIKIISKIMTLLGAVPELPRSLPHGFHEVNMSLPESGVTASFFPTQIIHLLFSLQVFFSWGQRTDDLDDMKHGLFRSSELVEGG